MVNQSSPIYCSAYSALRETADLLTSRGTME